MNKTAVITGASGGIGEHLAYECAKDGYDIILIARRDDELQRVADAIEATYNVQVYTLVLDITQPESIANIKAFVAQQQLTIDVLINNAGFGLYGKFWEQDIATLENMIQLNIAALTQLTHALLPAMVARNSGKILQVASTAGFMPGPLQAVYFATKAYVLSLTEAIAEELRHTNVTVTALCPGPVATGFAKAADLDGSDMFKNSQSPEKVASIGYKAMQRGKRILITMMSLNVMLRFFIHFIPRSVRTKMVKRVQQKKGR